MNFYTFQRIMIIDRTKTYNLMLLNLYLNYATQNSPESWQKLACYIEPLSIKNLCINYDVTQAVSN